MNVNSDRSLFAPEYQPSSALTIIVVGDDGEEYVGSYDRSISGADYRFVHFSTQDESYTLVGTDQEGALALYVHGSEGNHVRDPIQPESVSHSY